MKRIHLASATGLALSMALAGGTVLAGHEGSEKTHEGPRAGVDRVQSHGQPDAGESQGMSGPESAQRTSKEGPRAGIDRVQSQTDEKTAGQATIPSAEIDRDENPRAGFDRVQGHGEDTDEKSEFSAMEEKEKMKKGGMKHKGSMGGDRY